MKRTVKYIIGMAMLCVAIPIYSQDMTDSLQTMVFTGSRKDNILDISSANHVETIGSSGLRKMACCNLAESFENSASVSVGYADAVTGARQIRLLGLSGAYTQILDESIPVYSGLASPFALTYIPSPWLEEISISKGVTSVTRGIESITGQINVEPRKPTDERLLFVNASVMDDTKTDLNITSAHQLSDNLSTVLLGHVSGNFMPMDMNGDGFMDDPQQLQFILSNRWLYMAPSGVQLRFGVRALHDTRHGGQMPSEDAWWFSEIENSGASAYVKLGIPIGDDGTRNLAWMLDGSWYGTGSSYGKRTFDAQQKTGMLSVIFQDESNESSKKSYGVKFNADSFDENGSAFGYKVKNQNLYYGGLFAEHTWHPSEKFTSIAAVYLNFMDYAYLESPRAALFPRLTLRYAPVEPLVFRLNVGRGEHYSTPLIDNIGVLSTSKNFYGSYIDHVLEKAWTGGLSATWTFPLGWSEKAYISMDAFHTEFEEQLLVDYESMTNTIAFTTLSKVGDGRAWSDALQFDFFCEPVRNFTVNLSGRLSDAYMPLTGGDIVRKPMMSLYKGVLGLQYATNMRKWIFDLTASVNGPCRVYEFMKQDFASGYTPVYPLLYAQVTKRFRGFEVYVGAENLTGFRQEKVIFGNLSDNSFDASCIWGPIMGRKIYAGVRYTLWKMD